jgi:hypothetical protein
MATATLRNEMPTAKDQAINAANNDVVQLRSAMAIHNMPIAETTAMTNKETAQGPQDRTTRNITIQVDPDRAITTG